MGELLQQLDDGLYALIERNDSGLSRETAFVSLVDVQTGCVALRIAPSAPTANAVDEAYEELTQAIAGDGLHLLPARALTCVHFFHDFTKRHNGDAQFTVVGEEHPRATLRSDAVFSEPSPSTIKGVTTIYGEVRKTGGEDPKVCIRLADGRLLQCDVKQSIAEELAHRLYKTVSLTGTAEWNSKYQVIGFSIQSYNTDFQDIPLSSAFAKLKGLIGAAWDKVDDPEKELRRIRYSLD